MRGKDEITVKGIVDNNRKIRLGIAGCGRAFERLYCPSLIGSADWDLAGVCDKSPERREWVRSIFPHVPVYDSIDTLIDEIALDAMVISTPPENHCELTVKAVERGLHVLVEKPMALTHEEANAMLESSRRSGRHLRVGFNRRFRKPYRKMREILTKIPPESIQSIFFKFIFSLSHWNPVVPFPEKDSRDGGVLGDVASHLADLIIWITGTKVARVRAESQYGRGDGGNVVSIEMKFENGIGATGIAGHGQRFSEHLEIRTDKGRFIVFPAGVVKTGRMPALFLSLYCSLKTHSHFARHRLFSTPNLTQASMADQLREFAAALRGEEHMCIGADGPSGIDALLFTLACGKSLQSKGAWISLTDMKGNRL